MVSDLDSITKNNDNGLKLDLYFQQKNLSVDFPFMPKSIESIEIDYLAFLFNNKIGFIPIIQEHTSKVKGKKIVSQEIKYLKNIHFPVQEIFYINTNKTKELFNLNFPINYNFFPIIAIKESDANNTNNNEISIKGFYDADLLINLAFLILDAEIRNMLLNDFLYVYTDFIPLNQTENFNELLDNGYYSLIIEDVKNLCRSLLKATLGNNIIENILNHLPKILISTINKSKNEEEIIQNEKLINLQFSLVSLHNKEKIKILNKEENEIYLGQLFIIYKILLFLSYYFNILETFDDKNLSSPMEIFLICTSKAINKLINEIYNVFQSFNKDVDKQENDDKCIRRKNLDIELSIFPENDKKRSKKFLLEKIQKQYDNIKDLDEPLKSSNDLDFQSEVTSKGIDSKPGEEIRYLINPSAFAFKIINDISEIIPPENKTNKCSFNSLYCKLKKIWNEPINWVIK